MWIQLRTKFKQTEVKQVAIPNILEFRYMLNLSTYRFGELLDPMFLCSTMC